MPQVKEFIICLVINTNGHIYASRQHSSQKSLSANLSVYIRYGTVHRQVYTRKPRTLEFLEDYSHSKSESSKITRTCLNRHE